MHHIISKLSHIFVWLSILFFTDAVKVPINCRNILSTSNANILLSKAVATLMLTIAPMPVFADATPNRLELADFMTGLDSKKFTRVIFHGINPSSATVIGTNGEQFEVINLPAEDPRSPSGTQQVIAKVQHTPGVICQQDVSDVMSLAKTKLSYSQGSKEPQPMLTHSSYPKDFDRNLR